MAKNKFVTTFGFLWGTMPVLMVDVSSSVMALTVEGSYMYHVHQMFTTLAYVVYQLCLTCQLLT